MELFDAIILGLVQGVTEFLPISSTGHLVLVRQWLLIDDINALALDAVLHLATTLAIIVYFWSDIRRLLQTLLRKLGRLPVREQDWILLRALLIGTVPAVVAGVLLQSLFAQHTQSALFVAGTLFFASLFFMYAEWRYLVSPPQGKLTVRRGVWVGVFQMMALLPGMSRSGATLAGGMLLGMSRLEAARFSFLLAIPITLGVGTKMLLELLQQDGVVAWLYIGASAAVAFVTALGVIHFFLAFIRRYTLWPFVWYGIVLAALVAFFSLAV